ncbi:MAG: hypothetical protein ABSD47_05660 [Candidatus Methylomirabilota bacterium]|jgi:hypothetical protein
MDRTQKPRIPTLALGGRNAWLRGACDRTAGLRARLLTGDAEAAQVTRGTFHLLYWEHRGQQIFPLPDDQKNLRRRGDR